MPPIDNEAVDKFLKSWNGEKGNWTALDGSHVLLEMNFIGDGKVKFDLGHGYPLKAFRNMKTGEVKIFDARRFTKK